MNDSEIFDQLIDIFRASSVEEMDFSKITPESDVYQELGITSISAIYMALEIESRFGVVLDNEDAASIHKVRDLIALIKAKI